MDAIIKKFPDARGDGAPNRPTREEAEAAVEVLIRWAGDDPAREGLRETPTRVAKAYDELFGGYRQDASAALGRVFEEVGGYDDVVVVRDIDFHSHCEHHMVPIIGRAHVAYLPAGPVLGLSKISRVVDIFARRLQTQEKLTVQIATAIDEALKPRGVAVVLEAEHLCMAMRGVKVKGSKTITSSFNGIFAQDRQERDRVLSMMRGGL